MPIPAGNIVNVEAIVLGSAATGGAGAKSDYNVFTYRRTTTISAFTKAAFNAVFQATVTAAMAVAMNTRWAANNVSVRVLDDYLDAPTSFACADVGAIATDSLPLSSPVYMLLRTALRGGNYRGSKHFSPANEIDTTQDILTGAGLARWQALQTAVAASLVDANGNTWVPTVYSRSLSFPTVLPVATIVANEVTSVLLDLNIGTMQRRRSRTTR